MSDEEAAINDAVLAVDAAKLLTESGKEVDFLVTDMATRKKRLVQVTWEMSDKATFDREYAALVQARSETGITDCTIVTWEDERDLDDGIQVAPRLEVGAGI